MPKPSPKGFVEIRFRAPAEMAERLEADARSKERSMSGQMRWICQHYLDAPPTNGAPTARASADGVPAL